MKQATKGELKLLKRGDEVRIKENKIYYERYIYQWRLITKNREEKYLVFCCWEKAITYYIWQKDLKDDDYIPFQKEIYLWDYDQEFIWNEIIKHWKSIIKMAKEIYLNKDRK